MIPIYEITRLAPINFGVAGHKQKNLVNIFDRIFPFNGSVIGPLALSIDCSKQPEKPLYYFYHNIVRHYTRSPLGQFMKHTLGPGDIFLDIGANLGCYSMLAKRLGCEVWVFEPEPMHCEFLKRNTHVFDQVWDVALSAEAGDATFFVADAANYGGSSLVESERGWESSGYSHVVTVAKQRLDTLIANGPDLGRIKLAKIDVEGAELSVLEGMLGILASNPMNLWCEVRGEESDRNPGSYRLVCELLEGLGYRPYIYERGRIVEFSERFVCQVFDILFMQSA